MICRRHHLDAVGAVLIREMRIEAKAGTVPVAGVDVAGGIAALGGAKKLAVGGGGRSVAPYRCDRQGVMRIDDALMIRTTGATRSSSTTAAVSSPANRCATSSTRPAGFDRPSLRPGRKIDAMPETGRPITNKMRQIKCLRNQPAARSGSTLWEADRPLREGTGTQKPSMRCRRLYIKLV